VPAYSEIEQCVSDCERRYIAHIIFQYVLMAVIGIN